jgi:hypothetical protein
MIRVGVIVLGIGLTALWALGLWADRSAVILWFDAVMALLSFGVAGIEREDELGVSRGGAPALIGLGLAVIAIAGVARGQPRWANGANFLFALAYLSLAVVGASQRGQQAFAQARSRIRPVTWPRRGAARHRP